MLLLLGTASCDCQSGRRDPSSINPLIVSENYVRQHHPDALPDELERAWHVEDHGDIWTVEMFVQGSVGGGVKMAILKSDGRVLGSELTQ